MTKETKLFRRTFIQHWRKRAKMTQEQLAEQMDMVPSSISMLEAGKRGYTQETLEGIADILGTDVPSLLTRAPNESDGLWSVWEKATPSQRRQIIEIAKTITRTEN